MSRGRYGERNMPVVTLGDNMGLVRGSVPVHDEIVLSVTAMNNVVSFGEESGVLVCASGCILENLDN
ncbi:hypothetical protein PInf_008741 [Phytophthora infestans]|nr:hypothetical protein PInf_008741 [Phytophthora infestans]